MNERARSAGYQYQQQATKGPDLGPKKTLLVLVIVVGCFAVLWPKVFYPMLLGSANQYMKPSEIDKRTGCCDVFSESDVNTIKILSELCGDIIQPNNGTKLTGREIVKRCQAAVLETCGIDISAVLQEQIRLGRTVKEILDQIRSLNGSLCLKYHFGVAPWKLGVPHLVASKVSSVKQERPLHLKADGIHPAFRERGRAIPHLDQKGSKTVPRVVEGRPGPIPGMRPPMGGAGHVVPPPQQGTTGMGMIMPFYTVGIVIFFTYTLMKLLFKKQPQGVGGSLYPPVDPDRNFRREVFNSEKSHYASQLAREGASSKLGDDELDHLRRRLRETEMAMERIVAQMAKLPLGLKEEHTLANGGISTSGTDKDQTSVKVLGMEMTASCEGGQKWNRPDSPIVPVASQLLEEPPEPPQAIYLEGSLPAQSQLLVADSATEAQPSDTEDPAVVLASKVTLSVIGIDSGKDIEEDTQMQDGEEAVEISKYTTASMGTTAEQDISEGDKTDEENDNHNILDETGYDINIPEGKIHDILTESVENNENGIKEPYVSSSLEEAVKTDTLIAAEKNMQDQLIDLLKTDREITEVPKETSSSSLIENEQNHTNGAIVEEAPIEEKLESSVVSPTFAEKKDDEYNKLEESVFADQDKFGIEAAIDEILRDANEIASEVKTEEVSNEVVTELQDLKSANDDQLLKNIEDTINKFKEDSLINKPEELANNAEEKNPINNIEDTTGETSLVKLLQVEQNIDAQAEQLIKNIEDAAKNIEDQVLNNRESGVDAGKQDQPTENGDKATVQDTRSSPIQNEDEYEEDEDEIVEVIEIEVTDEEEEDDEEINGVEDPHLNGETGTTQDMDAF